ncbi:hypothetical protein DRP04_02910 [Archaeoglobales archaeon]|nr:MAG: hypothetical protein DRP04_02910 [Archaeoglobales archaeon]
MKPILKLILVLCITSVSFVTQAQATNLTLMWKYKTDDYMDVSDTSSSPCLEDIDGDGRLEIFIGSKDGCMYAFKYNGTLLWKFKTNGGIASSPAVVDINSDGKYEVVFGSCDGNLYVIDAKSGKLVWKFTVDEPSEKWNDIITSPAIADINGDSSLEIVFASFNGKVYAIKENGTVLWEYDVKKDLSLILWLKMIIIHKSLKFGIGMVSSPSLADVNGDGYMEVFIGSRMKTVFALSGKDGHLLWKYEAKYDLDSSPAIADIDKDGELEVIIGSGEVPPKRSIFSIDFYGSSDNTIYVFDGKSGRIEWKYQTGGGLDASPTVADIDNDGYLEIIEGTLLDRSIYALNHDGSLLWKFQTGGCIYSTAAVADVNGDGKLEVVVGSKDGNLYILNGSNGDFLTKYVAEGRVCSSPAVADIDGDGRLEIVFGGGKSVYVLKTEGRSETPWKMYKHDPQHTGLYSAGI